MKKNPKFKLAVLSLKIDFVVTYSCREELSEYMLYEWNVSSETQDYASAVPFMQNVGIKKIKKVIWKIPGIVHILRIRTPEK